MVVTNPFKRSSHIEEAAETYLRTSQLLLQAVGLHAVEGEPDECQSFRNTIERLQSKIGEKAPLAESLIAVGAAARAMHEYGSRTTRFIKAQNLEWQEFARLLLGAVGDFAPTALQPEKLRDIHWKIGKVADVEDIRDLKKLLSDCLEAIRNQVSATKTTDAQNIAEHEPPPEKALENAVAAEPIREPDSLTGLLARSDAEIAIRESRRDSRRSFVVLFVIDRLRHIKSRFGDSVGDRIIALFLQRLTESLPADDRLFRWGEASVVSLVKTCESEDQVRRQIQRILFKRLVETFTIKNQSVVLPISATWIVVSTTDADYDAVVSRVDSFVEQNLR